jgi:hypothetical protein
MDFETDMREAVASIAAETGLKEDDAFAVWYLEIAHDLDRQEAVGAASYDGGNDHGIDAFYVDDELHRIVVAQIKYFGQSTKAPKPAQLALLLNTPDVLADPQALRNDGRPDLATAAEEYVEARGRGYSTILQIVYPGEPRAGLQNQARSFNRRHADEDISAQIVPLEELDTFYASFMGSTGRIATGTLDVVSNASFAQVGSYGKAIVATVPGTSLKRLWDLHGHLLFEQDVRLALPSRKGSVNAGIRDTIDNPRDRCNFWAYNNGITIVARSFTRRARLGRIELHDFSIVNGCQTTVMIGRSTQAAVENLQVLVRIVAAPRQLADSIIKYTNAQTPIRPWEMSARDKDQQRLRRELESLPSPWFYALRRGEFDALADKERFGSADNRRVLPFPVSIQFLAAYNGLPVEAYKDKAKIFTVHKERVLPPTVSAEEVLWAYHIGQATIRVLPEIRRELATDDRAQLILKRGAHFFATSISAHLIRDRNGHDFVARIDVARLADKAMGDRLNKYARLALLWYVRGISHQLDQGKELGALLRTPSTNDVIRKYAESRMAEERLAPHTLEEKLPVLPGIPKKA